MRRQRFGPVARRGTRVAGTVALATLLATGCGGPSNSAQAGGTHTAHTPESPAGEEQALEDAIAVQVEAVARRPISALYSTSATLRADKEATITCRTAGVVKHLLVEEGDWVEAGQVLAILDDDEQKIQYERAVTSRDTKMREYERAQRLHEQGLTSDDEYETVRREAEELRQTAELDKLMLERTQIRASFAGRITQRHLDVGNTVTNGTPFYDIADLDPLYADVTVPERQIARLSAGQRVRLAGDGALPARATAVIERIAPVVDPTTGTVKVTIAVQGGEHLRPGSFVRVEIITDTREDALVVPRSALVAEGRRWFIYRVGPDGRSVEQVQIEPGFEEADRVEIRQTVSSDGTPMGAGDRVVVRGASALADGAVIRILDEDIGSAERAEDDEGRRVAT